MSKKKGFHHRLVVQSSFWPSSTQGLPLSVLFSSFSSGLGTVFRFFFWQLTILDFQDRPVAFSQLSFFLVSFEKEPSSNASVICCENSMEYSYLRFETQLNWETRLCYGLKGNPTFTVEQHTRSSRAMPLSSMGQDPHQQCTLRVRDRMLPKKKTCCLDRVSLQQRHWRRVSYYQIWRCAYRARYLE